MIRFSLTCEKAHAFEAWFSSSGDYESQRGRQLVACPVCNSTAISKALMTPQVATSRGKQKIESDMHKAIGEQLRKMRQEIVSKGENVGERFPEEARRIHYEETAPRPIYGQASRDEVKDLLEEGVQVLPLPPAAEDAN